MNLNEEKHDIEPESLGIISTLLHLSNHLFQLVQLEAQLAKKSIIYIVVLFGAILAFALTTWTCFCASLFFYFLSLKTSIYLSLFAITFINLIFIYVAISIIKFLIKNLFFPRTVKQLFLGDH